MKRPSISYLIHCPTVRHGFFQELRKLLKWLFWMLVGIAAFRLLTGEPLTDNLASPVGAVAGVVAYWIISVLRTYSSVMENIEKQ